MSKNEILNLVLEAYFAGISKGLLLADNEQESKELFDAFLCYLHDAKTSTANNPITFEPKSNKWIKGTQLEADKIYSVIAQIYQN